MERISKKLSASKDIPMLMGYEGSLSVLYWVQSALLKTGLNIYDSFLHSNQDNKPTLVFDMVEPFRQLVVDREIISILNRGTKLKSSKGRLSKKSVKVITENIQERLATPTIKPKFKGFVGRL